jgi:hypothetical protein
LKAKAQSAVLSPIFISLVFSLSSGSFTVNIQLLTSKGLGRYSQAASITNCTQTFCKAEPQVTGYKSFLITQALNHFLISSTVKVHSAKYFSIRTSSCSATFSINSSLNSSALSFKSAGIGISTVISQ